MASHQPCVLADADPMPASSINPAKCLRHIPQAFLCPGEGRSAGGASIGCGRRYQGHLPDPDRQSCVERKCSRPAWACVLCMLSVQAGSCLSLVPIARIQNVRTSPGRRLLEEPTCRAGLFLPGEPQLCGCAALKKILQKVHGVLADPARKRKIV